MRYKFKLFAKNIHNATFKDFSLLPISEKLMLDKTSSPYQFKNSVVSSLFTQLDLKLISKFVKFKLFFKIETGVYYASILYHMDKSYETEDIM